MMHLLRREDKERNILTTAEPLDVRLRRPTKTLALGKTLIALSQHKTLRRIASVII